MSETVEYLASQVIEGRRKSIDNPAGLIIYSLENALPVPATFMSTRKRKAAEEAQLRKRQKDQKAAEKQEKSFHDEMAYSAWIDDQQDRAVREAYSDQELALKLAAMSSDLARRDERVRRMTEKAKQDVAYRLLRKEISAETQLPTFDEWRSTAEQTRLF